jgi:ribonuclease HI
MTRRLIVEADGGSRGNPGVAAGGAVVVDPATDDVLSEVGDSRADAAADESMDRREGFRRDLDGGTA